MRLPLLLLLASVPVSAAPCSPSDFDPALPSCLRLHAFHELDVSAAAGATARAATDGTLATESARADASYALGFGHDIPSYSLELAGGLTASRLDASGIHAWGAGTRLSLYLGPATPPLDPAYKTRGAYGFFPIELSHDGELAALPALDSPADVARTAYSSEHVEARTSFFKGVFLDQQPHEPVRPWAVDVGPAHGELDATLQDTTRIAGEWDLAMAAFSSRQDVRVVMLELDTFATQVGARAWGWQTAWPLRIDIRSPTTGTLYQLGYGITGFPSMTGPASGERDLYALGFGDGRWGAGYERRPYIAMNGQPVLEDRVHGEVVIGGDLHVTTRAFVARSERTLDDGTTQVDWTGGVEGDGARRVGPLDVGVRAELGRSFYASLDDAAPSASFGARAAVTVSRAVARRYAR